MHDHPADLSGREAFASQHHGHNRVSAGIHSTGQSALLESGELSPWYILNTRKVKNFLTEVEKNMEYGKIAWKNPDMQRISFNVLRLPDVDGAPGV